MANLVSAWTDKDRVYLVERADQGVKIRTTPARYSFFVTGVDDADRATIGRDRRVTGVSQSGAYTRVDCRDRWARKELVDMLKEAAAASQASGFDVLEGDVSPLRRLMSDVASLEVDPNPRLGWMDLETDTRFTFTEMREGKARILSWAVEVMVDRGPELGSQPIQENAVLEADHDDAERRLLEDLMRVLNLHADVVLAWFGDGFDFPVLQNRCEELGVQLNGGPIPWHRWCWLDHLEVYKKYNLHSDEGGEQKSSFKLDHVAKYLLGVGKHEFDTSKTHEAWVQGGVKRQALLDYNIQDTALLPRIEEATGYVALHLAVCHICRVFPDTESLKATAQADGFLLRLGDEHGYRWPTKFRFDGDPEPFAGAYVMVPKRLGAIDNVHVCDFAGLYPAIMRTFNMSLDTKIPKPEGEYCQLPNRRTYFRTDKDGMLRIAMNSLVAKRGEYTAAMKAETPGTVEHAKFKRLSGAFKIVANSFYGVTGSPFSRFFDVEIAEGVTQTGRWLLEQVVEEAERLGMDPFYGDTDSVFVTGTSEQNFREMVSALNYSWAERLEPWGIEGEHHIDLDFEKTFRRLILVSAKRYAGSFTMYKGKPALDAKPEIKGLEFKRGDTMLLAREMQTELIDELLADELPGVPQMRALVERWRRRLSDGELSLEDVVISQSLSKAPEKYGEGGKTPPAHARVAMVLKESGEELGEGSRVSYLVTTGGKKGEPMNAVPVSAEAFADIDRLYYWDKRVYPPTQRVLEVVFPEDRWAESTATKRQRAAELAGQTAMSFGSNSTGKPRSRRRKPTTVTVTLEVGDDRARGRLQLEAIKAILEANTGNSQVKLQIRGDLRGDGSTVTATLPVDQKVSNGKVTRSALERIVGPDALTGFASGK